MANDITYQMVTFHLGEELYGVNIMEIGRASCRERV